METKNIQLKNPITLILRRRLVLWVKKMAPTSACHVLVVIFVEAKLISETSELFFGT